MPARATQASPLQGCGLDRSRMPQRRSIRLRDYDYTRNGAYFVTVCTNKRLCLFGEIEDGLLRLSPIGQTVDTAWHELPAHTPDLMLDAWVVMPNHVHGILVLPGTITNPLAAVKTPQGLNAGSLGAVIGGFKSAVSRTVNAANLSPIRPLWQRNYFERIIRDDSELDAARTYIEKNPLRWEADHEHPRYRPQRL